MNMINLFFFSFLYLAEHLLTWERERERVSERECDVVIMTTTGVLDLSYMPVTIGSFIAFMIIYKYASPKLSTLICPKYQHLTDQQQINWNTR